MIDKINLRFPPLAKITLATITLLCALISSPTITQSQAQSLFKKPDKLLKADSAFQLSLQVLDNKLLAQWKIADGYYLYKNKLQVFKDTNQQQEIEIKKQTGELKSDPLFGDVYVFYNQTEVTLLPEQLRGLSSLTLRYQGCADMSVCYPPQTKTLSLQDYLPLLGTSNPATTDIVSETDTFIQKLLRNNFWITLGVFFIAGLLLSFTPCVLPMLPILSSILVKEAGTINTQRAFAISLTYVAGTTLTYTSAGVITALLGENLQAALQNPWVLVSFSLLFTALALSMFGFYNLSLQQKLLNRLTNISNNQKADSYIGVFTMGSLSALIVAPCVTAPLAGALLYIAQTGNATLGGSALFMLSLGMNLPLLLLGTAAGKWLPKTNAWMQTVNHILGIMLLATAIWMLDRVIPKSASMLLWSALFIITAVHMGAFKKLEIKRLWHLLTRGVSWAFLIFGVLLLTGALSGGQSIFQLYLNQPKVAAKSFFRDISTGVPLQQALASAKTKQKPSIVYITATWCITCKELDLITFQNTKVIQAMGQDIILKVDVTKNTDLDKRFQKVNQIIGPPSIIFYDSKGQELRNFRIIGMISPNEFIKRIKLWKAS